jgi:hypothetical protein
VAGQRVGQVWACLAFLLIHLEQDWCFLQPFQFTISDCQIDDHEGVYQITLKSET